MRMDCLIECPKLAILFQSANLSQGISVISVLSVRVHVKENKKYKKNKQLYQYSYKKCFLFGTSLNLHYRCLWRR